jgi:hypothetical protein
MRSRRPALLSLFSDLSGLFSWWDMTACSNRVLRIDCSDTQTFPGSQPCSAGFAHARKGKLDIILHSQASITIMRYWRLPAEAEPANCIALPTFIRF